MLKPFLKYVLLDPHQNTKYSSAFRSALYAVLIQESRSQAGQSSPDDNVMMNAAARKDLKMFLLESLLSTQVGVNNSTNLEEDHQDFFHH